MFEALTKDIVAMPNNDERHQNVIQIHLLFNDASFKFSSLSVFMLLKVKQLARNLNLTEIQKLIESDSSLFEATH